MKKIHSDGLPLILAISLYIFYCYCYITFNSESIAFSTIATSSVLLGLSFFNKRYFVLPQHTSITNFGKWKIEINNFNFLASIAFTVSIIILALPSHFGIAVVNLFTALYLISFVSVKVESNAG